MQFQYVLYLILLLSVGCDAKEPPKSSNESKPLAREEHPKQEKSKLPECVERADAGIEVISLTEEWAKKLEIMSYYQTDPGFTKWLLLFHDIPDGAPYAFEQKRVSQPVYDRYYPCPGGAPSESVVECKKHNVPTGVVVGSRGYLLGEKITIRLSGKDAHREVVFYPRPLFLKKGTGEVLVRASLLSEEPGGTLYEFDVCGVGKEEKYKLISYSGKERLSHDAQGPMRGSILPGVVGKVGGYSSLTVQVKGGASYSMELPWGRELLEYREGKK